MATNPWQNTSSLWNFGGCSGGSCAVARTPGARGFANIPSMTKYDYLGNPSIELRRSIPGGGYYKPEGSDTWQTQTYLWSKVASDAGAQEAALLPAYKRWVNELTGLKELQSQLGGRMDVYASWMIGNRMQQLKNKINSRDTQIQRAIGMGQVAMITARNWYDAQTSDDYTDKGWNAPSGASTRGDQYDRFVAMMNTPSPDSDSRAQINRQAPIPEWMQNYFTAKAAVENTQPRSSAQLRKLNSGLKQVGKTQIPVNKVDETDPSKMYNMGAPFRPVSAQANLNPTQVNDMLAYLGWSRGGRPMIGNAAGIEALQKGMSESGTWFDYFAERSASLFPKEQDPRSMRARWR